MRILIGSAGRRVYLLRWFREALKQLDLAGEILITENDASAATVPFADRLFKMPKYESQSYAGQLQALIEEIKPDLFFSVNDYELNALAGPLAKKLESATRTVISLSAAKQAIVSDKYEMAKVLPAAGIPVPATFLPTEKDDIYKAFEDKGRIIVKNRFGSGSSGLRIIFDKLDLNNILTQASRESDSVGPGNLIFQEFIAGDEFGIDVVAPLLGTDDGSTIAVLARKKLRMRAGETDKAVTISPANFKSLGQQIGLFLNSRGLIDVDIMVEKGTNRQYVIDINPRFGGGYPFMHVAGANVPRFYIENLLGIKNRYDRNYDVGIVGAKFEDITASGSD